MSSSKMVLKSSCSLSDRTIFWEVRWMNEWNPEDEIDWLTGEYTYRKEGLRKAL
jgi:hypothetical protein